MRPAHRVLMVLGPLVMMLVTLLFYRRADAKLEQVTRDLLSIRAQLDAAVPEERSKLERESTRRLYERHTMETSRGFWAFSTGVSFIFLLLASAFVFFEHRHTTRRDRLIQQANDQ